jgi:hypothetical protein
MNVGLLTLTRLLKLRVVLAASPHNLVSTFGRRGRALWGDESSTLGRRGEHFGETILKENASQSLKMMYFAGAHTRVDFL